MCSVAGNFNPRISFSEYKSLNLKLSHRGPDNSSVKEYNFSNKKLFLAHNRLSIQDLSVVANQPMENDRFAIVFNGEIYNHLEIREELNFKEFKTHSDTETLLFAFLEFGIEKTLKKLIGMFAIALFDKNEDKLYLIRDRVGIKPLYFTYQNSEFAFASEIKGLPKHLIGEVSSKALIQFLSLSYIPHNNSYYENIHKLKPAHFLIFDGKSIKEKRYWELPKEKINVTFEEAIAKTSELLESAVKYRLLSDLEVGTFLSGGIDSSLITSIMQKNSSQKIKAFSIGFEESGYDESGYAKEVANYLGVEHFVHKFSANDVLNLIESFDWYFDEPFGDASALPMMLLSKMTKNKVSVALSGDGGDELFLGYSRYFFTKNYYKKLSLFPQFIRDIASFGFKHSNIDKFEKMVYPIKNLNHLNLYSVISTSIKPWELTNIFSKEYIYEAFNKSELNFLDLQELPIDIDMNNTIDSFSKIDFYRYLPDDILTKVDRATMKYALEARVPILDHRVVEYAYSLPTEVKLLKGQKSILKEILYSHIPKELIDRPKQGFSVPLKEWFRDELKELLFDKINSLDKKFNREYLLKLANEHINSNKNYEYIFWNLMRVK